MMNQSVQAVGTYSASNRFLEAWYGKLSFRDFSLLQRSVSTLESNVLSGEKLPWSPRRGILPSHTRFRGIWNWDSAFHAVGVSRWNPALAREQIEILLDHQLDNG